MAGSMQYCSLAACSRLLLPLGKWRQVRAARAFLSPWTLDLLGGDAAPAHVAHRYLGLPVTRDGADLQFLHDGLSSKGCLRLCINWAGGSSHSIFAAGWFSCGVVSLWSRRHGAPLAGGGASCLWASVPNSLPPCSVSRRACLLGAGSANGAAQMSRGRSVVGCWQWAWMWRSLCPAGQLTCMAAATSGGVVTMGEG